MRINFSNDYDEKDAEKLALVALTTVRGEEYFYSRYQTKKDDILFCLSARGGTSSKKVNQTKTVRRPLKMSEVTL